MSIDKAETNNGIVTRLTNVRPHSNADRLQLATVLGNTVVIGLDMRDGDKILYFDSNLALCPEYIRENNLSSVSELNKDPEARGYFGKNGRVKAQKFRGETSNGYVAFIDSLEFTGIDLADLLVGTEFQSVCGVQICKKFVAVNNHVGTGTCRGQKGRVRDRLDSDIFWKHWDTKQFMANVKHIPDKASIFIEEKVHGTSGRTGHVLCRTNRPWWKAWAPRELWKVASGTRRVDNVRSHITGARTEVERRVTPHLHKGEQVYYEIYGYGGEAQIQKGYPYGCKVGEFRAMLYRVTVTTPDGFVVDLPRRQVYKRAEELGLEKPIVLAHTTAGMRSELERLVNDLAAGRSRIDPDTLCEGVVVWFEDADGRWTCLKRKSEEFLLAESKDRDKEIGDVEDVL